VCRYYWELITYRKVCITHWPLTIQSKDRGRSLSQGLAGGEPFKEMESLLRTNSSSSSSRKDCSISHKKNDSEDDNNNDANDRSGIVSGHNYGIVGSNIAVRDISSGRSLNAFAPFPGPASATAPDLPRIKSRTTLHSLLSPSTVSSTASRKGRSADADTSDGDVRRANISMPPSTINPSAISQPTDSRHPSVLAQRTAATTMDGPVERSTASSPVLSDSERMPVLTGAQENHSTASPRGSADMDLTARSPKSSGTGSDVDNHRLSISSIYSLGSTTYSGVGGSAAPSTAGSHPGSLKGYTERTILASAPALAAIGGNRADMSSTATTATDPVSVTTISTAQYPGLGTYSPHSLAPIGDTSQSPLVASSQASQTSQGSAATASRYSDPSLIGPSSRTNQTVRRSRSRTQRRISASTVASSASPNSERAAPSKERDCG